MTNQLNYKIPKVIKIMDPTRCMNKMLGTMIQCYEMTRLSLAQTVEVKKYAGYAGQSNIQTETS